MLECWMVNKQDRAHFERIAAAERKQETVRLREELARPALQRIVEGLMLGEAAGTSPAIERMLDERALGQAELHARARRLGLIRR
jgi:hypothetical protein